MEIARWDELQLVQRCKDGSEAAFAELVRRYRPRLFTLAYRLTADRETAEDVVQETFVAAFRALDRFEPRPSLGAWLNTIAVRTAGRAATRNTQRPRSSLDAMVEDEESHRLVDATAAAAGDPQRAVEAAEVRREVAAAISALPFKYRAAVVTRYVLGLDYAEAAASLEMGLNTYKSHLLRGTKMLREALGKAAVSEQSRVKETVAPIPTVVAASSAIVATGAIGAVRPVRTGARNFAEKRRTRFSEPVPNEKAIRG